MTAPMTGVWAPTLTPLTEALNIDHGLLVDHCVGLLSSGCDGIVLFGSTGEAPSFSVAERAFALEALLDGGVSGEQIVVGTGCAAFPDTAELTQHATEAGVRGVLVIPPFFFKGVTDAGVAHGYTALCEAIGDDLRLYLYNFPGLSVVPITRDIIATIREQFADNLVGLKDSSGQISSLHTFTGLEGLAILPGTERLMIEGARHGATGVITATANIAAPVIARVWEQRNSRLIDDSAMLEVRSIIEAGGTIPTMKRWLAHVDGHDGWNRVRPPLVTLPAGVTDTSRRLSQLLSVE